MGLFVGAVILGPGWRQLMACVRLACPVQFQARLELRIQLSDGTVHLRCRVGSSMLPTASRMVGPDETLRISCRPPSRVARKTSSRSARRLSIRHPHCEYPEQHLRGPRRKRLSPRGRRPLGEPRQPKSLAAERGRQGVGSGPAQQYPSERTSHSSSHRALPRRAVPARPVQSVPGPA